LRVGVVVAISVIVIRVGVIVAVVFVIYRVVVAVGDRGEKSGF
jgi:hypothetical protein